jgi:hypothetical protein|tara:strand:+ start:41 stop:574 length:534 start_codon:yes stop_codon:yes gene_type:complete
MTKAQGLSDFAAGLGDTLKIDGNNNRVGINSTAPTEALDVVGNVKVSGSITGASFTGIDVTSLKDTAGGSVKVQANGSGAVVTGVLTATKLVGDGSELTGVSGFATALSSDQTSPLNVFFKTPQQVNIGAGTSVTVESDATSGDVAFIRESIVHVAVGATFHIKTNNTLVTNVLGVF